MILSAADAANRIGETVTVEMLVQRTKSCTGSCQLFLDSETDYRDPKNHGIVLSKDARAKFQAAAIDDPSVFLKGKSIRVHGVVVQREKGPAIEVKDPSQIELL